jgi:hypothetical protein
LKKNFFFVSFELVIDERVGGSTNNADNMGEFLADMGMGFVLAFGYGVHGVYGVFLFFFNDFLIKPLADCPSKTGNHIGYFPHQFKT